MRGFSTNLIRLHKSALERRAAAGALLVVVVLTDVRSWQSPTARPGTPEPSFNLSASVLIRYDLVVGSILQPADSSPRAVPLPQESLGLKAQVYRSCAQHVLVFGT